MNNTGSLLNRRFNVFADIVYKQVSKSETITQLSNTQKSKSGKNFDSSDFTRVKSIVNTGKERFPPKN